MSKARGNYFAAPADRLTYGLAQPTETASGGRRHLVRYEHLEGAREYVTFEKGNPAVFSTDHPGASGMNTQALAPEWRR